MQLNLSGGRKASRLSALLVCCIISGQVMPALAKTATKKHPKGFVHDTAGDGKAAAAPTSYTKGGTPKWIQYDWGGLYYYNKNDTGKARQYWLEALREAEVAVPRERASGLTKKTADACCDLIKHLAFFVDSIKFKKGYDASYYGSPLDNKNFNKSSTNPVQGQLDGLKETLREMQQDWDWYERICGFADRAIGKQSVCMRQIYNQRAVFERKIVMTRQTAIALEKQLGIDPKNSQIDTRPLKWGGVEGAGNPFDTPGSNPTPIKLRGGAQPDSLPGAGPGTGYPFPGNSPGQVPNQ